MSNKWTRVEDGLPEHTCYCWVVTDGDDGFPRLVDCLRWRDTPWCAIGSGGEPIAEHVTHWQRIHYPEPPTEEGK